MSATGGHDCSPGPAEAVQHASRGEHVARAEDEQGRRGQLPDEGAESGGAQFGQQFSSGRQQRGTLAWAANNVEKPDRDAESRRRGSAAAIRAAQPSPN